MLKECVDNTAHYFIDIQYQLQGEYRRWYPGTQQLREQCFYVNGKLHGECKLRDINGNLTEHCIYNNDKIHGECRRYKNGQLTDHCFFINTRRVEFDESSYPVTGEDRMYFALKYGVPLLEYPL